MVSRLSTDLRLRRHADYRGQFKYFELDRQVDGGATPSTTTRLPVEADCRSDRIGAYSGDWYHACSASMLGNSTITSRCGFQSPSRCKIGPPRTKKRPPNRATSGTTWRRYSS